MEAYIYDAVRTPRGAARKGSLKDLKPVEMLAQLYTAIGKRTPLDFAEVNDVILGCVTQIRDQGANIAKTSLLYAGLPDHIPGMAINRYCASGLDAVMIAAARVSSRMDQLVLAGGVESSSRVPMLSDEGAWFSDPEVSEKAKFVHMGVSADLTASLEDLNREALDDYAFQSHIRAKNATANGYFSKSLIPLYDSEGQLLLEHDELIRNDISMEALRSLKPTFSEKYLTIKKDTLVNELPELQDIQFLHHPGNSPSLADGAALLAIGTKELGIKHGIKPRAKIIAASNASANPLLLTGGNAAVHEVLKKALLTIEEIDLIEFNEAFAGTVVKFQQDFNIPSEKLNPNGGVIAMGHALGATGGTLLITLIDELERRQLKRGLVAISGGAGVGAAVVVERM